MNPEQLSKNDERRIARLKRRAEVKAKKKERQKKEFEQIENKK
jgi:hypothetical protein